MLGGRSKLATKRASMRVQRDIAELNFSRSNNEHASTTIEFPEGHSNVLKVKVTVSMTLGPYAGGHFPFMIDIPPTYPFHAPIVTSMTRSARPRETSTRHPLLSLTRGWPILARRVWHPNFDVHTGKVRHPLCGNDWRPVLSINTVIFGLQVSPRRAVSGVGAIRDHPRSFAPHPPRTRQLLFLEPNPEYPANPTATEAFCANRELFNNQVSHARDLVRHMGVTPPSTLLPHYRSIRCSAAAGSSAWTSPAIWSCEPCRRNEGAASPTSSRTRSSTRSSERCASNPSTSIARSAAGHQPARKGRASPRPHPRARLR